MKILKEGKAHKAKAIYITCDCCKSDLRFFLDLGDPRVGRICYNCDSYKEWCWYICPVCGKRSLAEWRSPYFKDEVNCRIEEIILEKEDLEEIEQFEYDEVSDEDKEWLVNQSNRVRI